MLILFKPRQTGEELKTDTENWDRAFANQLILLVARYDVILKLLHYYLLLPPYSSIISVLFLESRLRHFLPFHAVYTLPVEPSAPCIQHNIKLI
jgi:hypothetical protein